MHEIFKKTLKIKPDVLVSDFSKQDYGTDLRKMSDDLPVTVITFYFTTAQSLPIHK